MPGGPQHPKRECETRWGSYYEMVSWFCLWEHQVQQALVESSHQTLLWIFAHLDTMKQLCEVLGFIKYVMMTAWSNPR